MKDMKEKRKGLFSITEDENEYFNAKQEFIELVSCPREGKTCSDHRTVINQNIRASHKYLLDKAYPESIDELKIAFHKTTELKQTSCVECAKLFRSTITRSMEQIRGDLEKMSSGILNGKRYQASFELATQVLEEFKKDA